MEAAIVHLDGKFTYNVKPYVMLSRLTNGVNMGIIGTWSKCLFSRKPDPVMLRYLLKYIFPVEKLTLSDVSSIPHELVRIETILQTLGRGSSGV